MSEPDRNPEEPSDRALETLAKGGPLVLPLSRPVHHGNEELTSISLAEPTLGALRGVRIKITDDGIEMDLDAISRAVANAAGIPPYVAAQIHPRDLAPAGAWFEDFFGAFLPT